MSKLPSIQMNNLKYALNKKKYMLDDTSERNPLIKSLDQKDIFYMTKSNVNYYNDMNLDEWDKKNLKEEDLMRKNDAESIFWKKKLEKKTTKLIENDDAKIMNFKNNLQKDYKSLKSLKSIKELNQFVKSIEEEKSSIVAQTISVSNTEFKTGIGKNNLKSVNFKTVENEEKTPVKSKSKKKVMVVDTNSGKQKFQKLGSKLTIVNRVNDDESSVLFEECKINQDISVSNRVLINYNMKIKGKYMNVISGDNYREIVSNRRKMEKNLHDQIANIIVQSKKKNELIDKLNLEIVEEENNFLLARKEFAKVKEKRDLLLAQFDKYNNSKEDKYFKKIIALKADIEEANNDVIFYKEELKQNEISYSTKMKFLKNKIKNTKLDIKSLSKFYNYTTNEAKIYYFNLLKEGIDVRDVGLSWIIFRLYELEADVNLSHFPVYIDEINYRYLVNYTQKKFQIAKLKALIECIRKKFVHNQDEDSDNDSGNDNESNDSPKRIHRFSLDFANSRNSNTNDHLYALLTSLKNKSSNQNLLITHKEEIDDLNNTKKALEYIRSCGNNNSTSNKKNENFKLDLFGNEEKKINKLIKNCGISKDAILNTMITIREEIYKLDNEMKDTKIKHIKFFKEKYAHTKQYSINECVKYDVIFYALFGHNAII